MSNQKQDWPTWLVVLSMIILLPVLVWVLAISMYILGPLSIGGILLIAGVVALLVWGLWKA